MTALLLVAGTACDRAGPETTTAPAVLATFTSFSQQGVSFDYPEEWQACACMEAGAIGLRAAPGEMNDFVGPLEARLEDAAPGGLEGVVRDYLAERSAGEVKRTSVDVPGATSAVVLTFTVGSGSADPIAGDLFAVSEEGVSLHLMWVGEPREARALQAAFDCAVETLRMDATGEDQFPDAECQLPPSQTPAPEVRTERVPAELAGTYRMILDQEQMTAAGTNREQWTMTIEGDRVRLEGTGATGETAYTFRVLDVSPPSLVLETGSCGAAGQSTVEYDLTNESLQIVDVVDACPELQELLTQGDWQRLP